MSPASATWLSPFGMTDESSSASGYQAPMPKADRWIWTAAMALMALGTVMVLSSSVILAERRYAAPGFFWKRQLIWWGLATLLMLGFSRFDYRRLKKFAPLLLLAGLVGLVAVLFAPPVNNAHRWIPLYWVT